MIPREFGPKACSRVERSTLLDSSSARETVTAVGWLGVMAPMVVEFGDWPKVVMFLL